MACALTEVFVHVLQDFHAVGLMIALFSAVIALSVVHFYREGA